MPRGRPLDETEQEINDAARVDDRDVAEAQVWAREHLPGFLEGLREAEPITDEEVKRRRRASDLPEL